MKSNQMSFEFNMIPEFSTYSGTCKCGHKWEYEKNNIVIEMTVPCPKCGTIIKVD